MLRIGSQPYYNSNRIIFGNAIFPNLQFSKSIDFLLFPPEHYAIISE